MAGAWPLTGRSAELGYIAGLLRGRPARGVVLAGGPGVGKSRLAREALGMAAARGCRTHLVAATTSASGIPLGCFAPLLATDGSTGPATVLRRAIASLVGGAGRAGAVLVVDDAHLLDDASATLVHQLSTGGVLPMVLTVRSGEPAPDAVTALWKDGDVERMEVQPLSAEETRALVEGVLDSPVDGLSADRLWRVTRGNALYLQQLVEGEIAAGNLAPAGAVWSWTGEPSLRPQLIELVDARIGRLSGGVRHVLECLAFAEPLGAGILGLLADPAAVEEAEDRGLVTARGTEVALGHPLYGEVVRTRISTLRARRLRTELAGALSAHGESDPLRLALLRIDGDGPPDPRLLTRAAHRAAGYLDIPLAERLAGAARAAGGGLPAALALVWALMLRADEAAVEAVLDEAAPLVVRDEHRVAVALFRASSRFFLRRTDDAGTILREAQRALPAVSPLHTELVAYGAYIDSYRGRLLETERAARAVLASPDPTDEAVAFATVGLAGVLGASGRVAEVVDLEPVAMRAIDRARVPWTLQLTFGDRIVGALLLAGRIDDADGTATRDDALTVPGVPVRGVIGFLRGQVDLARGALAPAVRSLRDAVVGSAAQPLTGWVMRSRLALTQALGMTGDAVAARRSVAEVDRTHSPHMGYFAAEYEMALAWVAAAEGAVSVALDRARTAATAARDRGQLAVEVVAWQTAVVFGDRTAAPRLKELAGLVEGPRAPIAAAHAAALASADGDALSAASVRWEEIGAMLLAADAAAQAADVNRRTGKPGSALTASARAMRLADRCDGAATPAMRSITRPLPLTAREREVAALAASGASNRDIAERLVLSVRTVEGHLLRACAKLGVSDRAALGPLFADGAATR